jgi:hypothetical protein
MLRVGCGVCGEQRDEIRRESKVGTRDVISANAVAGKQKPY